jgi:hypothetical protein
MSKIRRCHPEERPSEAACLWQIVIMHGLPFCLSAFSNKGSDALLLACRGGFFDLIESLLHHGANPNSLNLSVCMRYRYGSHVITVYACYCGRCVCSLTVHIRAFDIAPNFYICGSTGAHSVDRGMPYRG